MASPVVPLSTGTGPSLLTLLAHRSPKKQLPTRDGLEAVIMKNSVQSTFEGGESSALDHPCGESVPEMTDFGSYLQGKFQPVVSSWVLVQRKEVPLFYSAETL